MRYQVPQFIGVEDKIFGPLTAKQFLFVGGAAGVAFIAWNIFPPTVAVIIGGPVVILFLMFAFFKFNGWQPFPKTFENLVKFYLSDKIYLWKKKPKEIKPNEVVPESESLMDIPKLSDSKLKDISWSLDVNENIK